MKNTLFRLTLKNYLPPTKAQREFFEQDGEIYDEVFPLTVLDVSKIQVERQKPSRMKSLFNYYFKGR
tara:strand:+ start:961 stop:1161 length:201 start_codon:yes stop_codon:yes gene_type:complete